jgi:hypothetical protein
VTNKRVRYLFELSHNNRWYGTNGSLSLRITPIHGFDMVNGLKKYSEKLEKEQDAIGKYLKAFKKFYR